MTFRDLGRTQPLAQHWQSQCHPLSTGKASATQARRLHQLSNQAAVVVDLDGPAVGSLVRGVERDAQAMVDRRRNVLRVIGRLGRLLGERIGWPDGDAGA